MKFINSIEINDITLPITGANRNLVINGDKGACFGIEIIDGSSPTKWYDFSTNTFSVGSSNSKFLDVELSGGGGFSTNIQFPASGSSYKIFVHASQHKETQISSDLSTDSVMYSTSIDQVASLIDLTITPITTNTDNFAAMPTSITSSDAPSTIPNKEIDVSWTINSAASDTHGYGLRANSDHVITSSSDYENVNSTMLVDSVDSFFYFQTQDTTNGAIVAQESIVVDDITDIGVGMIVTAGTGLSGTPTILSIDEDTKTLTLSSAQTIGDGVTLTFRAIGTTAIESSIGVGIQVPSQWNYVEDVISKTKRGSGTGTTIELNGSRGISGGGFVSVLGLDMDNSSTNTVQTVSLGATTTGSVTVQVAQSIVEKTQLYFTGSAETINLTGKLIITSHPSANRTIYFDLDKFITIGVSGS